MSDLRATTCSSCNASIIFLKTSTGRLMPLDAKPEPRFILEPQTSGPPTVRRVDTFQSHFVTCPHAAAHRRKDT